HYGPNPCQFARRGSRITHYISLGVLSRAVPREEIDSVLAAKLRHPARRTVSRPQRVFAHLTLHAARSTPRDALAAHAAVQNTPQFLKLSEQLDPSLLEPIKPIS